MALKNIIKFDPIDLTQIIITIGLVLIIIHFFRGQLESFFDTLQHRPITVTMSGSETKIELDAPVQPELLVKSIANPQGSQREIDNWEEVVAHVNDIRGFQKLGFGDLYEKLSSLEPGELAVINFAVDNPGKNYFRDESMLKYLSIASEKVRYLALYMGNEFAGAIGIEDVISGLASNNIRFRNFGEKLKNGNWRNFPKLISQEKSFNKPPSVRVLYDRLASTGLREIPLIQDGKLLGLLSHKSVSDELYEQVSKL